MCAAQPYSGSEAEKAWRLLALSDAVLALSDCEELPGRILPEVAEILQSPAALVYLADRQAQEPRLYHYGLDPETAAETAAVCAAELERVPMRASSEPFRAPAVLAGKGAGEVALYPLRVEGGCVGLMGLAMPAEAPGGSSDVLEEVLRLAARAVRRLAERAELEKQLKHLNAYLTVSSALTQTPDLHEVLAIALYSSVDAVGATEASILLLDDEKKNFHFYQVEGPAQGVLMGARFPADRGLAGSVLRSRRSEVVNDVQSDSRFYAKVDSESGFRTRNMIAVPLVAGDEEVGVLEVINKADEGSFTDEERLLLDSLAEEIAFAIRNAKTFEYVVNTYCKRRQGETTCRGCRRPLGSWTPCVNYREAAF